ncbi:MAG TPA: hypothetical protein VHR46_09555 [Gaiella sp.]|nr:hypothetical protein [Gaiella sp.]
MGRQRWTTHVEKGERYTVCAACGKSMHGPVIDIDMPRHEYTGRRGGNAVDKIDNP